MRPWLEPPDSPVPEALAATVGGHPLVAQTLARRGFADPRAARAFLDPDAYTPAPPDALPGMARAVSRLWRGLRAREPICVWGDFDVDGQTSTALLVGTLTDLGGRVTYHVPVRAVESHGVAVSVLREIIAAGARLILTCDTGITAHEAVDFARAQGVDVIITDHHDLPPAPAGVPQATAVLSPKLLPADHALRDLPGVGVAYKLAEALYARAGRAGEVSRHLDLVALGIVADLAVQRADTRHLLQRGLALLRRTERLGLRVLLEAADLERAALSEEHIGFVLGPRLNAAGRLADANPCVELLTTADVARARILAADLEALNARRRLLCSQVEAGAEAQLAREPGLLEESALVLASPTWPAGVIGIVASRLVEKYGKPAILIATPPAGQPGPGRASARSVEGVNITAAIAEHAELLAGFGGHPMAAGFSIAPDQIPAFRRGLARSVAALRAQAEAPAGLAIDARLPLSALSLALADDLGRLGPFGPGNPHVTLLAERLQIRTQRPVGRNGEHRLLRVADKTGAERPVIWWDGESEPAPEGLFDLAYVIRASTYRGARELQVEWVAARPSAGSTGEIQTRIRPEFALSDYRRAANPRAALDALLSEGEVAVWREGAAAGEIPGHDRRTLPRAATLAIWTAPPGPGELRAALVQVLPSRVCLFGQDPGLDTPDAFLRRLAGAVKHVLAARAGRTTAAELAAATAQRTPAVRLGLAWLTARGHVRIAEETGDALQLLPGTGSPAPAAQPADLTRAIEAALAETAAYRAYFREAAAAALLRT